MLHARSTTDSRVTTSSHLFLYLSDGLAPMHGPQGRNTCLTKLVKMAHTPAKDTERKDTAKHRLAVPTEPPEKP